MGVTDLDNALLLAIREMLPENFDPIRVKYHINPHLDYDRHEPAAFMKATTSRHPVEDYRRRAGQCLMDLFLTLNESERENERIILQDFKLIEAETRKLEDQLCVSTDNKRTKSIIAAYVEKTGMPLEVAEYVYKKVRGDDIGNLFDGYERRELNKSVNPIGALNIAIDIINARYMRIDIGNFDLIGRPDPSIINYDSIDFRTMNAFLLCAAENAFEIIPDFSETIPTGPIRQNSISFRSKHLIIRRALSAIRRPTQSQKRAVDRLQTRLKTETREEIKWLKKYLSTEGIGRKFTEYSESVTLYGDETVGRLLDRAEDRAEDEYDFITYSIICEEKGKKLDFKIIDDYVDTLLSFRLDDKVHQEFVLNILNGAAHALRLGHRKRKRLLENIDSLLNTEISSTYCRKGILERAIDIYSILGNERGAAICLEKAIEEGVDYRRILREFSGLKLKDSSSARPRMEKDRDRYIKRGEYASAFVIDRALGGSGENFVLRLIRDKITKRKDGKFALMTKGGEYSVRVYQREVPKGFVAVGLNSYSVEVETEKGKQEVIIKENPDENITNIERKLCQDALGCFGRYVVIRKVPGDGAISKVKELSVDDEQIDGVLSSIENESRRINAVDLDEQEVSYIINMQRRREEEYRRIILSEFGSDVLEQIGSSQGRAVLVKDMNPTNMIVSGEVYHIDYNDLGFDSVDLEYASFSESLGVKNEDVRERVVEAMIERRRLDKKGEQDFYMNAFRYNVMVSARMLGHSSGMAEKVAAFRFYRAIDCYSKLDDKDDNLLMGMREVYSERFESVLGVGL